MMMFIKKHKVTRKLWKKHINIINYLNDKQLINMLPLLLKYYNNLIELSCDKCKINILYDKHNLLQLIDDIDIHRHTKYWIFIKLECDNSVYLRSISPNYNQYLQKKIRKICHVK